MSVYDTPVAPVTATSDKQAQLNNATYSVARDSTVASITPAATATLGQNSSLGFTCAQYFPTFDTTTIPAGRTVRLSLNVATVNAAGDTFEVRVGSVATNKIAGGSLSALTLLGSVAVPTVAGRISINLDTALLPRSSAVILVVHSRNEQLNTPPTGSQHVSINTMAAAANLRPQLLVPSGPWAIVGVGTAAEATATPLTLTEPAGVADGDLLVACIASRSTATTAVTNTGWTQVNSQATNNISTTAASAIGSGTMLYQVRSGAPDLTFDIPAGVSVARGAIVAYRGNAQTTPLDASTAATTAATLSVSVTGLTTTQDDDLIVAMAAGGQEAAWSAFGNVTTPLTASGATDTTTAPSTTAWIERLETVTTTGADTSLGVFDAVRTGTGATGNLTVTASLASGHVVIAGAFKIAAAATGDVSVAATGVAAASALGTVTVSAIAPVSFEAVGVSATTVLGAATATGRTNISTLASGAAAVSILGSATASTVWNVSATSVGRTAATALGVATASAVASISTTPTGQAAATAHGNVSVSAGGAVDTTPGSVTAVTALGTATVSVGVNVSFTPTGVSAAAVTSTGATAPSASILTSYTPGSDRNDFTGEVGVRLGIGTSGIPITWLGARRCHANQTGLHTLKLYEWFSGLVERTATIDYTGVAVGDYAWAAITPHTLAANGYYALLMVVTAFDGQTWSNPGPVTYASSIVNIYDSYYAGGLQTGGVNSSFVGLDLGSGASGAGGVVVTGGAGVPAAGATALAASGTVSVTTVRVASVTPVGVGAFAAYGSVSIAVGGGIDITPASLSAAAVSGTVTVAAQQQVSTPTTGASATVLPGAVSVSVRSSVAASGAAAAAVVGTASITANQAITTSAVGVTAGTVLGGISASAGGSVGVVASGQSALATVGTASVAAKQLVTVAATGVSAATADGVTVASGKTNTTIVAAGWSVAALVGSVSVDAETSGAGVGVWNGSAWAQKSVKVWNGSSWVPKPVKSWDGSTWRLVA